MEIIRLDFYGPISKRVEKLDNHTLDLAEVSVGTFFSEVPLYEPKRIAKAAFFDRLVGKITSGFDAHCFECGRSSVFHTQSADETKIGPEETVSILILKAKCQRDDHILIATCKLQYLEYKAETFPQKRLLAGQIEKIGQTPSHADIAIGDLGRFKSVLKGNDRSEFIRANGLAANGVFIGAFVYLRRVFERLVERAKTRAGDKVSDEDFNSARMVEKIGLLKDFLPSFMVANKTVYGVLSKGIHELDEKTCGNLYELMRQSALLMLEQEKDIKEREEIEANLSASIAKIDLKS